MYRAAAIFFSVFFALLMGCTQAFALPGYLSQAAGGTPINFVAHYDTYGKNNNKGPLGSTLVNGCFSVNGCVICHSASPPSSANLSQFAIDWRAAWIAREPARAVDAQPDTNADMAFGDIAENATTKDSDGDAITNINEILGTGGVPSNPGDKMSTPTSPNCQTAVQFSPPPSGNGQFNANELNAKCGAAGMLEYQNKDVKRQVTEHIALLLLPLFVLLYLRVYSTRRASGRKQLPQLFS